MRHLGTKALETNRLVLRPFRESDAQMMFNNWASDEEVTRYLLWFTHQEVEETKDVVSAWVDLYGDRDYYHWALEHKVTGDLLGSIILFDMGPFFPLSRRYKAEVGYCLGRKWWGHGLASEAVAAIFEFSFLELGLKRLVARHDHRNLASGRVMQKLQMSHTRFKKKAERGKDGKWIDCDFYRLDQKDYLKNRQMDERGFGNIFHRLENILK